MSRTIGAVRDHAPYLYLTKESETSTHKFVLFILVSVGAGKKVVYNNNISYDGGVTTINVSVQDDSNGVAGRYPHKLLLDYTNDGRFSAASYCVQVKVSYTSGGTTVTNSSKYTFEDTFDVDPTKGSTMVNVAYECPYLYLTNPNSEPGQPNDFFNPSCLVLLHDYDKDGQDYDETDGNCVQTINLGTSAPPDGVTEIMPSWITVNSEFYDDPSPVDKGFISTVNYKGGPKKGRIRNMSSYSNPNSFIDVNPFFS